MSEKIPTWAGVHYRLRKLRGPASNYDCIDCGDQASDWTYQGGDPDELASPKGPYSLKLIEYYRPRCRVCHGKFDPPRLSSNRSVELGARLRRLRRAAGFTQASLAEAVGSGQPQISNIEVGRHGLTAELAQQLARALGADQAELLGKPLETGLDQPLYLQ